MEKRTGVKVNASVNLNHIYITAKIRKEVKTGKSTNSTSKLMNSTTNILSSIRSTYLRVWWCRQSFSGNEIHSNIQNPETKRALNMFVDRRK